MCSPHPAGDPADAVPGADRPFHSDCVPGGAQPGGGRLQAAVGGSLQLPGSPCEQRMGGRRPWGRCYQGVWAWATGPRARSTCIIAGRLDGLSSCLLARGPSINVHHLTMPTLAVCVLPVFAGPCQGTPGQACASGLSLRVGTEAACAGAVQAGELDWVLTALFACSAVPPHAFYLPQP